MRNFLGLVGASLVFIGPTFAADLLTSTPPTLALALTPVGLEKPVAVVETFGKPPCDFIHLLPRVGELGLATATPVQALSSRRSSRAVHG
jgi:hypothetical protein